MKKGARKQRKQGNGETISRSGGKCESFESEREQRAVLDVDFATKTDDNNSE